MNKQNIDLIYIIVGGGVVFIALFKRELLVNENSSRIILLIAIILFFIGSVDTARFFISKDRHFSSGAFLCPLITLLQYWITRRVFIKYVNREPKDTAFVFFGGKDIWKDRLFNLVYFIPAFWILILIIGGIDR